MFQLETTSYTLLRQSLNQNRLLFHDAKQVIEIWRQEAAAELLLSKENRRGPGICVLTTGISAIRFAHM